MKKKSNRSKLVVMYYDVKKINKKQNRHFLHQKDFKTDSFTRET